MKGQAQTTVTLYVPFVSMHVLPTLYPQSVDLAAAAWGARRTASSPKICFGRWVGCFPSMGRRSWARSAGAGARRAEGGGACARGTGGPPSASNKQGCSRASVHARPASAH
eukprot:scaffold66067_cov54-Phaeocystis_antarctica.AAC.1